MQRNTHLRPLMLLVAVALWACDDGGGSGPTDATTDDDQRDGLITGNLLPPAACATPFPAFGCEGNPLGQWELVGLCFETFSDCAGASVVATGSLHATLRIGGAENFDHSYDFDYDLRISVPQSCLEGRSCDSIGCFGTNHCSCTNGIGSSGGVSGSWSMNLPGRVRFANSPGLSDFCAGEDYADSLGGVRKIWRRVSSPCASDCDDGLACTQDYCAADTGGCANVPVPTGGPEGWLNSPECQNGLDDDCDGLVDLEDPECHTEPCATVAECSDDGNPCTLTTCDGEGFCRTAPVADGTPCPGSDACTETYLCRRDQCVPGPATRDLDQDGFVDAACQFGSDCDDNDATIHFGAEGPRGDPSCFDGIDNDCDGMIDAFDADCWEATCSSDGWCLEHPRPLADNLKGLWGAAPDDIWAVGDFGHIIHWDGGGWSRSAKPVYFTLEDVCGCAADDVWAVSTTGDIVHYDGDAWRKVDRGTGGPNAYFAVDCLCDGDHGTRELWAVGRSGKYSIFDGSSWHHGQHPSPSFENLNGVWIAGPGEAWAVGRGGLLSRYAGGAWQDANAGVTLELHGIWGTSPEQIWSVGARTFLAFDGSSWSSPVNLGSAALYDVWGLGDHLWVAGDGVLFDFDRVSQRQHPYALGVDPPTLRAVRGFDTQDLWAVGDAGAIVHVGEQGVSTNTLSTRELWSVCGTPGHQDSERIWAVGATRQGFFLRDQGGWQMIPADMKGWMRDIYCAGSHGVFAVGDKYWMRWGDGVFEQGEIPGVNTADELMAVDGRIGPNGVELIAVGDRTLIAYYDGQQWTSEYLSSSAFGAFYDVWMSPDPLAALQAVAVGYNGRCMLYDGTRWRSCELGATDNLHGVWGDGQGGIWVVGAYGQLYAWNGSAFEARDIGQGSEYLHDVRGSGPQDVWILGESMLWHFDGSVWNSEPMDLAHPTALYISASDAWAVGRHGAVLRRRR